MKPKKKIVELVSMIARIPESKVDFNTHLKNDLHLNGSEFMRFIILLEDLYGLSLSNEQIDRINTIDDAHQIVAAHAIP